MTKENENQDDWLDSVGKDPDIKVSGAIHSTERKDHDDDAASKNR